MCYCLNDIVKIEDFGFDNSLLDENSYENMLIYDVCPKTLIGPKLLCIMLNKVDGFMKDYSGIKYLVFFGFEKYVIYDEI